ncbi:phosphoribosylglycinamide formyltransferase [Alcanivorax hongdengensis A-11-3]|uniref:Phosphoribosylglycinamide formyltransferase n=1 Tax=Alcanivorax hongdengensis A-11-3 TaxID=1177179 RepID=L0WDB7_9GAMM|nr:phosphoribosylglycinamide formyltransferase [Alcanivorax hongdengensis]EKF74976.1 phosphoribosylglycinamide formyltransferase [Alcanivorax hongdengensis A-11-3]
MSHRLVVLISGSGTNLQAIIDACQAGQLDAETVLVLSNRPDVGGLDRAHQAGIDTVTLDHRQFDSREAFDQAMIDAIDPYRPDTVVLAGFMRILSPLFVRHYAGRLLNIHPSLLPRHRGLHTHQRALEDGDTEHGCSIHFVTEELDGGPLIAQAPIAVTANDTAQTLSNRVQQCEHQLYPLVLQWRAQQRLSLTDEGVLLDGKPLPKQGYQHL